MAKAKTNRLWALKPLSVGGRAYEAGEEIESPSAGLITSALRTGICSATDPAEEWEKQEAEAAKRRAAAKKSGGGEKQGDDE